MGLTSGGGTKTVSSLTGAQQWIALDMMNIIRKGLETGATPVEGELFGPEEKEAFEAVQSSFLKAQQLIDSGKVTEALEELLSGEPSTEIDEKFAQDYFEKAIKTPMMETFQDELLPEIRRSYKGFTTREGRAVAEATSDLEKNLGAEASKLALAMEEARIRLAESAKDRQVSALGLVPSVTSGMMTPALTYGTLATDIQGRRLGETYRNLPENNPYYQFAMNYLGTPMGQVVNQPAKLTGFGEALSSLQAIGSTASVLTNPITSLTNLFSSSSGSSSSITGTHVP